MTTLTTDARLVTDFLSGDKSALAAIYDRYAPGLYDTARAMLSDSHDASDMVQDVFCIAAERLGQLREPERLKPWLYSVLRHEVYRRTKKRKRATPVDFQDEGTPEVASGYDPHEAGEAIAHEELASLVRSAASGLDDRDRLVLELSVRQGLSGADLADALGVTPEQSYSLVHRMRDRVEKSLGALTVAKAGRRDCSQLDQILAGWNGELTVLLRKRVNRHIEECATCDRNRKKFAPLALFGAAPVFAMPLGLRERVLAAAIPGGNSGGSSGSSSGESSSSSSHSTRIRFDARKGFPRAARAGRHVVAWAAATAVALVGTGVLVVASGDDANDASGASAPIEVDSPGFGTPGTSDVSSSDDRQIVSGGGSVISIFGDDDAPATITPTTAPTTGGDGAIGGAGDPASGPPAPTTDMSTPATAVSPDSTSPPTTTGVGGKSSPSTSAAPLTVQSIAVSTTKFDFGATGTAIKVVLSNPNSFPVSYTTSLTSSLFAPSPASGTLAGGQQSSLVVNFDRARAEADPKNFPNGSFVHSLTFTTSATGGSSSPTRTATLFGTIERSTTTSAPPTTVAPVSVSKVAGSLADCAFLSGRAEITGKVSGVSLLAEFLRKDSVVIGESSFALTDGSFGLWSRSNVKVQVPQGTQSVRLTVTATPVSGKPVSGTATLVTAC